MANFKWQDRFDIGITAANDDHKKLLELMDRLEDLVLQNRSEMFQKAAMNDLVAFTKKHFSEEEMFMDDIKFPHVSSHKALHRKVEAKLEQFSDTLSAGSKLGPDFFEFLNFWIASHICNVDIKYAEHAKSKR